MMQYKPTTSKILSLLVAMALVFTLAPISALAVEIGTGSVLTADENLTGTQVYFGSYTGGDSNGPILWHVVETGGGTATLWTTTSMGMRQYSNDSNGHKDWSGSYICLWLNGTFLSGAFSGAEQGAITDYGTTEQANPAAGNTTDIDISQKIVLPSLAEVGYGTNLGTWKIDQNSRSLGNAWWTRSPDNSVKQVWGISGDGNGVPADAWNVSSVATRPALKLDLTSVIFTSAASATSGKSSATAGGGLVVASAPTDAVKLTVQDSSYMGTLTSSDSGSGVSGGAGSTLTLNYSHSGGSGTPTHISAVIANSSGDVLYYGKLKTHAASGTAQMTIPAALATGNYTIRLFAEQLNGDKETDFASTPANIALTVLPSPTIASITPTSGTTAGGTSVTLTGTNLTGATAVTVGGTAATSFTVVNDTTITFTTPAGTGTVDVAVTTPGGTATLTGGFTYTHTATLTVNKDGSAYTSHGKTFKLVLSTNAAAEYSMTGNDGTATVDVTNGTWKVYDGATDTGKTITINNAVGSTTLNYYTVAFAAIHTGDASGSSISASYNGTSISTGTVVLGGKTLIITAAGAGALTYTYAWSGTGTSSETTSALTITTLSGAVNATCTVTGNGTAPTGIVVNAQPTTLTYTEGQTLSLAGLVAKLTFASGSPVDVPYADFVTYGIAVTYTAGGGAATQDDILTVAAHNGKTLTLTCNTHTATTNALTVNAPIANHTVTFNANGGTRTGGGALTQSVPHGTSATAPTVTRSGYTFTGWDKLFNNVTADMTVTAQWSYNGDNNNNNGGGGSTTPTTPDNTITAPTDDKGWTDAAKEIADAKDGSEFTIDMKNTDTVSGDFLESIAGKDVDIIFDMGGGVSWTVNGTDIPKGVDFAALNLAVSAGTDFIPAEVRNIDGSVGETQLRLSHNGALPFELTLTVTLDKVNAGYFANLFYYNPDSGALEFRQAVAIKADGTVEFGFDHASDYLIVVADSSLAPTAWQNPFTDVNEDDWFYGAVQFAHENGLFAGTSDTTFSPNMPMTRAMLVTVLWRLEGEPEADPIYAAHMMDVVQGAYYEDAMGWAVENNIISGYGEGLYGPSDPITREQLATILYRYVQHKGGGFEGAWMFLLEFEDREAVSEWAYEAVCWCTMNGIINGKPGNILDPKGSATRAEVATVLRNLA